MTRYKLECDECGKVWTLKRVPEAPRCPRCKGHDVSFIGPVATEPPSVRNDYAAQGDPARGW